MLQAESRTAFQELLLGSEMGPPASQKASGFHAPGNYEKMNSTWCLLRPQGPEPGYTEYHWFCPYITQFRQQILDGLPGTWGGGKDGGYAHQTLASESPTFHTEGMGVLRYAILSISVTRQNLGRANN